MNEKRYYFTRENLVRKKFTKIKKKMKSQNSLGFEIANKTQFYDLILILCNINFIYMDPVIYCIILFCFVLSNRSGVFFLFFFLAGVSAFVLSFGFGSGSYIENIIFVLILFQLKLVQKPTTIITKYIKIHYEQKIEYVCI